jgi:hypothetical protein
LFHKDSLRVPGLLFNGESFGWWKWLSANYANEREFLILIKMIGGWCDWLGRGRRHGGGLVVFLFCGIIKILAHGKIEA